MTRDDFKRLRVGDRVTHPAFIGFLTIAHVEQSYDYGTSPPMPSTDAFSTDTGHRLKIGDQEDVRRLQKLP